MLLSGLLKPTAQCSDCSMPGDCTNAFKALRCSVHFFCPDALHSAQA